MRPVPARVRERHLNEKKREIEKIRKKEQVWLYLFCRYGAMEAHLICNQTVAGSNPVTGSSSECCILP